MSDYLYDNAKKIDNSRTIHIDGSNLDIDAFLRDFMSDTPAPQSPATPQPQENTPAAPAKFPYIKTEVPDEIKEIEATMAIYVRGNNPSELCIYLFENEGTLFLKLPVKADVIYGAIIDRWGDQNHITKDGLRTAWRRLRPA